MNRRYIPGPELTRLYARVSAEAQRNSKNLLEDAKVLYRSKGYARAYALGVLSAEEWAKAYIYKGFSKGWVQKADVDLFHKNLTKHSTKIDATKIIASTVFLFYSNRDNWPLMEQGKLPNKSNWDMAKAEEIWKLFEKAESLKEDSFYVDIDKHLKKVKTPKESITWQMAKEMLDFMTKMNMQYDIQHQVFWEISFKPEITETEPNNSFRSSDHPNNGGSTDSAQRIQRPSYKTGTGARQREHA